MKGNAVIYSLFFSGLGVFSFFLLARYTELPEQVAEVLYSCEALPFFVLAFNLLGYATLRISSWLNDQYQFNTFGKWKIVSIYVLVSMSFFLLNYSLLVVAKLLAGMEEIFTFSDSGWHLLIVVWLVELIVVGLLLTNRAMQNNQLLKQQAVELQNENNMARYAALQSQLNPHFLFNSLNTLVAEIEYNPKNAVRFIQHLSNVYRYVLQCREKTLVSLEEEVEFMHSYLFLHKVRLGDCISCDCRISSDNMDRMIPPLTLQLLVENVINHNSITQSKPMKIDISLDGNDLFVTNPLSPKKSESSSEVGLKNLSNRCKLITRRDIEVVKDKTVFTVKVPVVV